MNLYLYPYNLYLLCISACIVIIFLIITFMHLNTFEKTLKKEQCSLNNIKHHIELSQIKIQAIKEKYIEDHKNDKYYKILIPILLAIYSTYQNDDELKGFKGYRTATKKVIQKRMQKR